MSEIRIIGQTEITTLDGGEYVMLDDVTDGSKKITPDNLVRNTATVSDLLEDVSTNTSDIADLKADLGDLQDLETEDKSSLVNAINEARGSGGSGLTADIKTALLQIAQKVAYIDENGQDYYDDLYDALYAITAITLNTNSISLQSIGATSQLTATTTPAGGDVTWSSSNTSVATVSSTGLVTSVAYGSATITATAGSVSATCSVVVAQATCTGITATYTQSGTVYDSDTLDSLKTDLVVTASWSNGTTSTLADTDYTLSGTLAVGTSTITVSYGGMTDTFNVTVSTIAIGAYPSFTTRVGGQSQLSIVKKSGATRTLLAANGGTTNAWKYTSDSTDTSLVLYPIPIGNSQTITITAPCTLEFGIVNWSETYSNWVKQYVSDGWVASGTVHDTSDYANGDYYYYVLLYSNNVSIENVTITTT